MSRVQSGLAEAKAKLRAAALAGRAAARAAAPDAAEHAATRFLGAVPVAAGTVVSGYRPIRDELDPTPLMIALIARGARLCVPEVVAKNAPLRFRAWTPDAQMRVGVFGAETPVSGDIVTPSVLITPLAAFDRAAGRVGYGGGFYDRTLDGLRRAGPVRAIGFAYAAQEVARAPTDPTDQPLDGVVTEREALLF